MSETIYSTDDEDVLAEYGRLCREFPREPAEELWLHAGAQIHRSPDTSRWVETLRKTNERLRMDLRISRKIIQKTERIIRSLYNEKAAQSSSDEYVVLSLSLEEWRSLKEMFVETKTEGETNE